MGYLKVFCIGFLWIFFVLTSFRGWYKILIVLSALPVPSLRPYAKRIWISDDQDIFAIIGGKNVDHTISGHVGLRSEQGKKEYQQAEKMINFVFWFDRNHCQTSIERDEI